MNKQERLIWIDRMRGLAILSVVIQHLSNYYLNDFVYHKLIGISNMAVFFFISGYILTKTADIKSIREYILFAWKKTIQLMLPFFIWGIIAKKYFFIENWEPLTMAYIIEEFIHPHLWFLLTLYGYVLTLPIFKLFSKWKGIKYGIVFWVLCIICMGIVWKLTGAFKLATLYIIYFATGTIFAQIKQIQSFSYQPIISAIAILCIFLLLPFWESGNTSISNIVVKIIISYSVIAVIYNVCTLLKWNDSWNKFILNCGKNSLVIYVVHWEFLHIIDEKILIVQNELIGITITLFISILICKTCILFKRITETSPIVDFVLFGNYSFFKNKKNNHS